MTRSSYQWADFSYDDNTELKWVKDLNALIPLPFFWPDKLYILYSSRLLLSGFKISVHIFSKKRQWSIVKPTSWFCWYSKSNMQYVPITQKSRYGTNLPSEVVTFSQSTNRRNIFPRSSDTIASFGIIAPISSVSYKK